MIFTLEDLKELETIVKVAGQSKSKEIKSLEQKSNEVKPQSLTEKIFVLTNRLRLAGYEKQAENLESSFVMYKRAETDTKMLYRAHSETGDDLLEMAHPDGDVEIAPAQDNHGHVETPISEHKKIIDIVTKSAATNTPIDNHILVLKFNNLKDFINKNFLTAANTNNKDPQYQHFLTSASDAYEIAEELSNTFNVPGQTTEVTAVFTISEVVSRVLRSEKTFNSIDEFNNWFNSFINMIAKMKPVQKAAVLEMLKKTLNIKESQEFEPTTKLQKDELQDFDEITKDVIASLERFLAPIWDKKFSSIKLDTGKTISDMNNLITYRLEKVRNSPSMYGSGIRSNSVNEKQKAANIIDDTLIVCFRFAESLKKAIALDNQNEKQIFTNPFYPKELISVLNGLNHRFLAFYNAYLNKAPDKNDHLKEHSKFMTPKMLEDIINPEINKINTLKRFIQNTLLADDKIKSNQNINNYLVKFNEFIGKLNSSLKNLSAENQKGLSILANEYGDITIEQVEKGLTDPEIKSQLDFSTTNNFKQSISNLYNKLTAKIEQLLNSNQSLQSSKDYLLSQLKNLTGAI